MNIAEAIKIAFLSLWANKLRSALTLLVEVIGVAAVIAVVTFVNGINGYVATKIFNLGADVFIVFKNSPAITNIDKFLAGEKRKDLTMEDYEAVLEACKHCEWVGAALRNESGHVKYGEQSISDTIVRGMTPSMVPILDIDLIAGRMITRGDDDNLDIETNDSLLSIWSNFSGTFFYAMIGIAAISLVVGGIVIMNIMLVSVTERTREIGIRKAMGARSGDILMQFLIESVTLALLGGAIGVLLGITFAKGVTLAIGMPSEIKLWAVLAGGVVGASVGIFFGVYPAKRAAVLDPIAALRFET